MRYGRRRQPDPAEEAAEAESWLADYRASSEDSGDEFPPPRRGREDDDPFARQDDPFGGGEPPAVPAPLFTDPPPPTGGARPDFDEPTGRFSARPDFDEPTGRFSARPDFDEPTGGFRTAPPRGEPTGGFAGRGAPPSYDEPTGAFGGPRTEPNGGFGGPPPRDEPTGGFGAPPAGAFGPRDEPSGSFGAPRDEPTGGFGPSAGSFGGPPPRDEPTGGFGAPPAGAFGAPRDEPTGGFGPSAGSFGGRGETTGGFSPPSRGETTGGFTPPQAGPFGGPARDEPTGAFGAPSAGSFGGPRDEPTGSFGGPRDEPTGSVGARGGVTPSYDEPTGSFGTSAAGTSVPRRPPVTSPHADEEPIFKRFDPSAPPAVPATPPAEEPILKYMTPGGRTGGRSTYGGRRRAPEQRPAISAPPANTSAAMPTTGPTTGPIMPTSPAGPPSGRRRRYRDDDEPTTSTGAPTGPPAGFAPEFQQAYPPQPAAFAEPPGGRRELPSRPGYAEPAAYADPPGRSGYPETGPAGYPDVPPRPARRELPSQPTYVEPPAAYSEQPGYGGNQGYADQAAYAEGYGDPRHDQYRRDADYPDPRYADEPPYRGDDRDYPAAGAYGGPAGRPELPAGPGRENGEPGRPPSLPPSESMRMVVPDTTGDMPRIASAPASNGGSPRMTTTGSIPRVGSGNGGTGRVASVGGHTTGSLPRIGPSTTGSLRPVRIDPVRPASRRPSKAMMALATVGVVVLLAVCGASTWFVFQDELSGNDNNAGQANTPAAGRDITSRERDPDPLTEAEVFPQDQIAGTAGGQYQILKKEANDNCALAATDDLAKLLTDNGCSQVVRGTMKSGDGVYLITAGIFNLKDEAAAVATHEKIEPTVKAQKGRFTGLLAGTETEVLARAPMVLGWHARGHYLAYCVIARADGQGFDEASQSARDQIQSDILTTHLRDLIIGARTQPKAPTSSPS